MQPFLDLVVIRSSDLEATRAFYEAVGLQFRSERHGTGPGHFSADVGGTVVELYPAVDVGSIVRGGLADVRLGFAVEDLDAAIERVAATAGTVELPPQRRDDIYRAVVVDPDGRRVELRQLDG